MSHRKMTPRGQMTRGSNTGPAIMLLPPNLRMIFGPNPPLKYIPPVQKKRRQKWTGMSQYLQEFERGVPKARVSQPTPRTLKEAAQKRKKDQLESELRPVMEEYRRNQKESGGDFEGMNCYHTLFVGRLAYEVSEGKLLREMEQFGPVKDLKLVKSNEGKSRGYAFVEYEQEEDMKRAYRAADGMPLEGRDIVVDVERGHTVPNWLPRRLGGGLGGTRLGGKDVNVTAPGRYDPSRPHPPSGMGRGGGALSGFSGGHGRGGGMDPLGRGMGGYGGTGGGGGPPPASHHTRGRYDHDRAGGSTRYGDGFGGAGSNRKRARSRSPEQRRGSGPRRRY